MENIQIPRATTSYTIRLDRTVKALQDRVKEQEVALEHLRASVFSIDTQPSVHPNFHVQQLRILKAAYESLIPEDPYLPSPESPLPALLALRSSEKCIKETEYCIAHSQLDLKQTQKHLEKGQSDLNDAKLIQTCLETRILSLQQEIDERIQKSPSYIAKEIMRKMKKNKAHYDDETVKLIKAFNEFIDNHLAAMLAAEELGGPIVGEVLDIDPEMLEAGFSSRGKARRAKGNMSDEKRQRRIDEIWGPRSPKNESSIESWSEKQAAAAEMRELTEQLLNSLVEDKSSGHGAYVELMRESAAARFLVRSKVAQFHPKDARRLRLLDFGGELDD